MKTALIITTLVGMLLQPGPMQGRWAGTIETPHGAAPFQLTVAPSDSSAAFELSFMGAALRGAADVWRVAGDSISFGISFATNLGQGEFRFSGRVSGSGLSGSYIGLMDGQEMNRGVWTLQKQP